MAWLIVMARGICSAQFLAGIFTMSGRWRLRAVGSQGRVARAAMINFSKPTVFASLSPMDTDLTVWASTSGWLEQVKCGLTRVPVIAPSFQSPALEFRLTDLVWLAGLLTCCRKLVIRMMATLGSGTHRLLTWWTLAGISPAIQSKFTLTGLAI